jgi:hypothetical protein
MRLYVFTLFVALVTAFTNAMADPPNEPGYAVRSIGHEPYTDWSRFHRILVHPLNVAYTTEFKNAHPTYRKSEISSKDLERARRDFQRAFHNKLARVHPLATDPGPDVLRVDAVLVNPVLNKSGWLQPGSKSLFRGETGVSLVVVLRDSETGAVLHRVKLPRRVGSPGFENSPLNYWGNLRLIFDRVATRVRWALDDRSRLDQLVARDRTGVRPTRITEVSHEVPEHHEAHRHVRSRDSSATAMVAAHAALAQ